MLLNGLGATKYEELFVLWSGVEAALKAHGLDEIVAPEVGELVTSLDMAGCSLTLTWLDHGLESLLDGARPMRLLFVAASGHPLRNRPRRSRLASEHGAAYSGRFGGALQIWLRAPAASPRC